MTDTPATSERERPTPAEIKALVARLPEGYAPGPWRGCKDGACSCGQVWSTVADFPVAEVTRGEWGDAWYEVQVVEHEPTWEDDPTANMRAEVGRQFSACGEISDKMATANASLIALAPEMAAALRALAAQVRELEAERDRLRETLKEQVAFYAMDLTCLRGHVDPQKIADIEFRRDRARAALAVPGSPAQARQAPEKGGEG